MKLAREVGHPADRRTYPVLVIMTLAGFLWASQSSCAHNYADSFVAAVQPQAERVPLGQSAVLAIVGGGQAAILCLADGKHATTCYPLTKPTPQTNAPPSISPRAGEPRTSEQAPSDERIDGKSAVVRRLEEERNPGPSAVPPTPKP